MNQRTSLQFEAVDYSRGVGVNAEKVGVSVSGSLPLHFDVPDSVRAGENEVVLKVLDATDEPGTFQLRGKQTEDLNR